MEQYCEVRISSRVLDASALARYIESFAAQSSGWEFPSEQSSAYEQMCGEPSCCVIAADETVPRSVIHLTQSGPRSLVITNIVPLALDQISLQQYNLVAQRFTRSIRMQIRSEGLAIRIAQSKAKVSLDELVGGKICRKLLHQYLGAHPFSGHPLDVARLDAFICSLFRYSRKSLDLNAFEQLLIEECTWPADHAKSIRSRVEVGLEVLAAYKKS